MTLRCSRPRNLLMVGSRIPGPGCALHGDRHQEQPRPLSQYGETLSRRRHRGPPPPPRGAHRMPTSASRDAAEERPLGPADAGRVASALAAEYAGARTELDHRDGFELLVATVLSAQTTDA